MKHVTGWDVAKAAGVSQATVSRVMTNNPCIGGDTRKHVLQIARKLGYDMSPASGSWTVGVIGGINRHNYFASLLWSIGTEIANRGLHMELIPDDLPEHWETHPVRGLIDLRLTPKTSELPPYLLPMVRINCESRLSEGIGAVRVDGAGEAEMATRFLWNNGHRNIRFISFEGEHAEKNKPTCRWPGFVQALREYGIESPERYGIFFEPEKTCATSDVVCALSKAMAEGCTGIICVNSLDTLRINAAIHAMRLKIPEELSVVDWEYEGVSAYLDPPRTTIAIRFQALAEEALNLLTRMVKSQGRPSDQLVSGELIVRDSVRKLSL